jgi:threonine aldolase
MKRIDLRSDTVTTPTEAMRAAMAAAEVGDDVYGEDPTVNRLESIAAARLGKEAGLFVPSGTMGNLTGLLAHTARGDEVILEEGSHIFNYEVAGLAVVGALMPRTLRGHHGILDPEQVRAAIRSPNIHTPRTALISVESTHNRGGGTYYPLDVLAEICRVGREHGIPVHLDGARIFNASVASGVAAKDFAAHADTVQFCFSKGLAAPVGSMLLGTRSLIDRARKYRKMLGGGMRQAGILAAAALVALETMVDRLAEDHANARALAEGLAEIPGIDIDLKRVQTNIVIFAVRSPHVDAAAFVPRLAARGVLAHQISSDSIRLVTHKDVSREDITAALSAARAALAV